MTSPLNALIDAARHYPEAECFVVSPVTWDAINRDARQGHFSARDETLSAIPGHNQMAVMGIPVAKTRVPALGSAPFLEVHTRDRKTLEPVWVRLL